MLVQRVPFVDLAAVNARHRAALRSAFQRVVDSAEFGTGAEVESFEALLAARVGARHAVGVASGTAAVQLILVAAGIGRGDEVILPANTFIASAAAVVAAGARPVLVDVDATGNVDPDAVAAAVTSRTAAVLAVHLYGQPADMTRLRRVADRHRILLVEDAAQAIGARWCGRPAGSLADAAAFSFYPTKNLGALGQAGAVTTSDVDIATRVAALRQHGGSRRNEHRYWGYNERLDALQAAFLTVKLDHLDDDQRQRDEAAARYRCLLPGAARVSHLAVDPRARHVHHLFVIRVAGRDEVRASMGRRGVQTEVHYPLPIHLQPAGCGLAPAGSLPNAERHAASVLSLPLYPGIPTGHIDLCVAVLVDVLSRGPAGPVN